MNAPVTPRAEPPMRQAPRAFTLIELLVVVTIIVLLMALLAPALERAIYAAGMAVCGSKLRTLGWTATSYAQDNKRSYPQRKASISPVDTLNTTNADGLMTPADDRVPLVRSGLFPLNKIFNDPLCGSIDVEQSLATSELQLPYNIWWSFKWTGQPNEQSLSRLYGRMTVTKGTVQYSFNVLASDLEAMNGLGTSDTAFVSHPDQQGKMYNVRLQDDVESPGATSTKFTYTKWTSRGVTKPRPPVDLNYVKADTSVVRVDGVTHDEEIKGGRLIYVWWFMNDRGNPNFISHLPRD